MKTRTRRAGGGLAAELDGLANPAPVSTELPDDDFDPTGGAVAREADRDDASSSGDSEPDANAFADDDEGVFEPTKAERARVPGKGKLRMRAGIAIDDGEYVGKSSSRRAMEGAWAGDEDDDASDEDDDPSALEDASEDVSEDVAMDVRSDDALSDEENDDGTPEEGSEEEHDSDDESESDHDDDDDDDDDDPYGGQKKTSASAFETSALEAELAAMRAEEAEANRLVRTKSQNAAKGAAVRTQNACWERSLRTRIVLQKGLTLAAKMPTPAYHRAMCAADAAVAPALAAAAASARGALGALLRLQAALMDANPAVGEALASGTSDSAKVRETFGESRDETRDDEKREKRTRNGRFYAAAATLDLAAKPVAAAWRAADASFEAFAPFRDQSCDRWHRKAQITSGKMGLGLGARGASPSALRAFDQALSAQVRAAMTPPDRLVNRSRPPAHLTPRRLGEPVSTVSTKRRRSGDFENDVENGEEATEALFAGSGDDENENETNAPRENSRVAETYEDADFYEQALKEFLETRGAGSSPGSASVPGSASKPPKRRKQVDRRASKGRKLRYHVQQPLVNFCAPVDLEVPGWAEKVFTRLFASSA